MTYSLAWHQGFAAGRSFERLEREWVRGAVERDLRGVVIRPPEQPTCPYDEEPEMTTTAVSEPCAICGVASVHGKCPVCAVPHEFLPYEAGSAHHWCKVCGLDEGDTRAHHESATA